jgi:hypothetical protein
MKSLFAWLLLAAWPGLAANLTRGPYLQRADATEITVVFRTDLPSTGAVRFGVRPGPLTAVVTEPVPSTEHQLRLTGLTPSTRYAYEVVVDGVTVAGGDAFRFRTHPPVGTAEPFRFFAWGDSGNGSANQFAVAGRMADQAGDAALSLILGDIVYDLGEASLYDDRYFAPYAPLLRRMVVWPTIGNHDVALDPLGGPYLDAFVLPTNNPASSELYYSFDYGDAHFVCLDTHVSGHAPGSAQLQWAAADLAASSAKWKFVFFHVPPYSGGTHLDDPLVRAGIVPMLEAAGVDVVFSGHSHVYERTYLLNNHAIVQGDPSAYVKASPDAGTLYVVSGTAGQSGALADPAHPLMAFQAGNTWGASVVDVSGNTLRGYFLDQDGGAMDLFRLSKGADTTAPSLRTARALSPTVLQLAFDEPLVAGGAVQVANYLVSPAVSVTGAMLGSDLRTVLLTTAPHSAGTYQVTATGLSDGDGNSSATSAIYEVAPSVQVLSGALKYFVGPTPTDWKGITFDDSTWTSGTQPIGYGAGEATTVSLGAQATLYTRAHFTPPAPISRLRDLTLDIDFDDGFVASLNGVEISRQNVPLGQTDATLASASHQWGVVSEHRLVVPPGLLVGGDNVLAIEVHNVALSSSDLFLSVGLRGVLANLGTDAGVDAGLDAGIDAGTDAGFDAGIDAGVDAGVDAGEDAGSDAGVDAGSDAGSGVDGSVDAGLEADAGSPDAGPQDAGPSDAGAPLGTQGGGCGCQSADGLLSLLGLALVARRRQRSGSTLITLR